MKSTQPQAVMCLSLFSLSGAEDAGKVWAATVTIQDE